MLGHCNTTCFPSMAPMQFGNCHFAMNSSEICIHCSGLFGVTRYCGCNASHMAIHVSFTITATVLLPTRYEAAIVLYVSPVARNLCNKKSYLFIKLFIIYTFYVFIKLSKLCLGIYIYS